jgi:hypothetical protein
MAPPLALFVAAPSIKATSDMLLVVPEAKAKMRTLLFPLIASTLVPGPTMLTLAAISGSAVAKTIRPGIVGRTMVPPPAAFASMIAWRKDPGPESSKFVTANVAAESPVQVNNVATIPAASRCILPGTRNTVFPGLGGAGASGGGLRDDTPDK